MDLLEGTQDHFIDASNCGFFICPSCIGSPHRVVNICTSIKLDKYRYFIDYFDVNFVAVLGLARLESSIHRLAVVMAIYKNTGSSLIFQQQTSRWFLDRILIIWFAFKYTLEYHEPFCIIFIHYKNYFEISKLLFSFLAFLNTRKRYIQ